MINRKRWATRWVAHLDNFHVYAETILDESFSSVVESPNRGDEPAESPRSPPPLEPSLLAQGRPGRPKSP